MMVNNQWIHIYNQEIDGAMWSRKFFNLKVKLTTTTKCQMSLIIAKTLHEIDHKINNDHEE